MQKNKHQYITDLLETIREKINKYGIMISEKKYSDNKRTLYINITKNNKYARIRLSDHPGIATRSDLSLWVEKRSGNVVNLELLDIMLEKFDKYCSA